MDIPILNWLHQIRELGFDAIELGYTLTSSDLAIIEDNLERLKIKVNSIHNFCPMPDDNPANARHPSNYYRLSSLDKDEQASAVEWTKACIDTACRVNCDTVVIHAGTLEVEEDPSAELINLYKQGKRHTEEYRLLRDHLLKIRLEQREPFLQALILSLRKVMDYAQEKKIRIGLETRYYPIEMPNFEEIGMLLERFSSQGMYYWHDVGHAEVNDRLGITPHTKFLETYKNQLIGVHLHGVKVLRDHLAPFDGDMDLNKFLPYFGGDIVRVIESRFATVDQIREGLERLRDRG